MKLGLAIAMLVAIGISLQAIGDASGDEGPEPIPTPIPCSSDEERLEDGACRGVPPIEEHQPKPTPIPTPTIGKAWACQEDEPCWDCRTMGNQICGPAAFPNTGGPPPSK